MNSSRPEIRLIFMLLLLGSLLVTTILIAGVGVHGCLIGAIIFILIVPMGLRFARGSLDIFEPLVLANIALGMMFIARPLGDLATRRTMHLGYPITETFDQVLLVVLLGIASFQLGYHSRFSAHVARYFPRSGEFKIEFSVKAAWLFFILGGLLFSLFLASGGGVGLLLILLKGRATDNNAIFVNGSGYLYQGIMMWMASALIFIAVGKVTGKRRWYLAAFIVAFPVFVFYGARGTRSFMLPLIIAIPVFLYLFKGRRPSLLIVILSLYLGLVAIGWLGDIRTVDSNARTDVVSTLYNVLVSPVTQLNKIINGPDDEMFDTITNELLVVPEKTGYRPFGQVVDIFVRIVPHELWPGSKPLGLNNDLQNVLWPKQFELSRAGAAYSVMGPLYFDSGYVGVAVWMYFIGVFLNGVWRWYKAHSYNITAMLVYSLGLPFVVILMRGTITDTLARMLFVVIPLVIMAWLGRYRYRFIPG